MALLAKTNQLTGPASTGAAATTDPAFTPKVLLTFGGLQTAGGAVANAQFSLGMASSSASRGAGYNATDNVATSAVSRYFSITEIIRLLTAGTATGNVVATLTSFDTSGFTPNFGTLTTTSPLYHYLALGGNDISNVAVGSFASNTVTGNQSVSGLGFQPDIVFFFGTLQIAAGQANNQSQYSFGVMTPTAQWSTATKTQNAVNPVNSSRAFSNAKCFTMVSSTTNVVFQEMSYVSMDSGGFTFSIDTAGGTAILIGYLAIKGGKWKVGTDTQPISATTKQTTGLGFRPSGLILASVCDTQTSGTADHSRFSFGASSGPNNNVAVWTGDRDAVTPSIANTIMSNTNCIVLATEGASASPTTNAQANVSSFGSDDFTLNWTTADSTARVFGYIVFGNQTAAYPRINTGTRPRSFAPGLAR